MNIIHITPTLGSGGAEVLLGNIAIEQAKRGNNVMIILLEDLHPTYPSFFLRKELERLVTIKKIDAPITFSLKRNSIHVKTDEMDLLVKSFKPNIIHSHLFKAEIVSRAHLYDDVKYITHCHNNMEQFSLILNKPLKRKIIDFIEINWLIRKYKKCKNTFIAISKDTKAFFTKQLPGDLRKNIVLLNNCINTSLYYQATKDDRCYKLISIGNLTSNKGHDFLIDVAYSLHKKGLKISLDILGYGPLEKELKDKINKLKLSNIVHLRGNVDNVNEYLSKSHLYLHAAYKEGFGLVLLEAMASGLPVISTDGGGNRDLITNGHNGYLIEKRNVAAFAEKVVLLLNNKNQREEMGKNALSFSKKFDVVPYADTLETIYKQ